MGQRINTVMQTCFFAISNILPKDEAIAQIKAAIKKTYSKKGDAVVQKNYEAVDASLEHLHEVKYPMTVTSKFRRLPPVPADAPEFVKNSPAKLLPTAAINFRFRHLPKLLTVPGRQLLPNMKNAALQLKFRFGILKPAFSAASALWYARTVLSV